MVLHRLAHIEIGVPAATLDGGERLVPVEAPQRGLAATAMIGVAPTRGGATLRAAEPVTGIRLPLAVEEA